ncbi:hypothetical protein JCM12296A_60220 [Desulfosarcina cetonica]
MKKKARCPVKTNKPGPKRKKAQTDDDETGFQKTNKQKEPAKYKP